ncbi:MAG: hypothetical protein PHT76_10435 [Anaerostipes sp.]|nr:hypothetical protein [Anaerostipes sp.]
MTKENVLIFSIAIAFAIGVVVIMKLNGGKLPSGGNNPTTETILETQEEEMVTSEKVGKNPVISDDFAEKSKSAKYMSVEKVIRTMTESADGSTETKYDSYVLSEIDLVNQKETTMDYSNASVGDGFEVEKGVSTDFKTEFGFDYQQMNGEQIYDELLKTSGIDADLNQVTFDTNTFEMTGQEIYVLDKECSIIKNLLEDTEYDELISSEVSYQLVKTADEINVPDYFTAVVQYRVNEQIITKNLFLQISFDSGN